MTRSEHVQDVHFKNCRTFRREENTCRTYQRLVWMCSNVTDLEYVPDAFLPYETGRLRVGAQAPPFFFLKKVFDSPSP